MAMALTILTVFSILTGYVNISVCAASQSLFIMETMCDVLDDVDTDCFDTVTSPRGRLECFVLCGYSGTCLGVAVDVTNNKCYQKQNCLLKPNCALANPDIKYYRKIRSAMASDATALLDESISHGLAADMNLLTSTPQQRLLAETTSAIQSPAKTAETTNVEISPATTIKKTTEKFACRNKGIENENTGTCSCFSTGGWVGDYCERRPYNCNELNAYGYKPGTYRVLIDIYNNNTRLVDTFCRVDLSKTYYDIGILKSSGMYSNNRSWQNYVDGFTHDENNFWLGLGHIFAFTNAGSTQIGIEVKFITQSSERIAFKTYSSFKLTDESKGYSYSLGYINSKSVTTIVTSTLSQTIEIADVFGPTSGVAFSTYDNDSDAEPTENCADLAGAGWWFKACESPLSSNILGWNYISRPGSYTTEHIVIPGLDMKSSLILKSFSYVHVFLRQSR